LTFSKTGFFLQIFFFFKNGHIEKFNTSTEFGDHRTNFKLLRTGARNNPPDGRSPNSI
jgi:hypothetical protein